MPAAIPPPYRTTWRRCLAIVALGLTSALFFSPIGVGSWWWQPVLAAGVLFVAVLLNAIRIRIRSAGSSTSIGAALRGPVATGVDSGVLGVAAIELAGLSYTTHSTFQAACFRLPRTLPVVGLRWIRLMAIFLAEQDCAEHGVLGLGKYLPET